MFRLFLSILWSFAFAFQVLVIVGCGGSASKTATSSGGGSGTGNSPSSSSSSGCSGSGSGYNNQNGSVTGVWLQSPSPGQNPSNVQVNATAYTTATISQWTVCLDGQAVYQTDSAAASISQPIDMTAGQHLLWATVSDVKGDSNRSEVRLIQVGAPPPSSTVLPAPPANAQVLKEMQNDTTWSICSLCAAGTNTTGNYWMKPSQSQPSLSGSSLEMYADGPSWTNVLFMDTMPGTSSNSHFLWDFWVYHDPAAEAHFWSSEFDLWQVLGGKEFMIGSQCDFGDGYWSTWDSQGDRWVLNGIPCPHWTPGWHHIQWYVERINPTQYRYDTLVFDGQGYGFNQTWTFNSTTWPDMIGIQYQLDQDPTGTPLHEWVDNVTLTMW
ncbi:MAG TPA: hypothetical protein VGF82_28095 [Terracidiphilus sp.]|jgi:hypothetical protein